MLYTYIKQLAIGGCSVSLYELYVNALMLLIHICIYTIHTHTYTYIYIYKCTYQLCIHVYQRCISELKTTSKRYAQLHIARINSLLELHFATTTICESSRLRMAKSLNAKTLQNSFYCAGFLALLMLPSSIHNKSICGFLVCWSPNSEGTMQCEFKVPDNY